MPMAYLGSFASHNFWKINSARNRVLQNISVILLRPISSMSCGIACCPLCPAHGTRPSGNRMVRSGSAAASPSTKRTWSISPLGASHAR